MQASARSLLVPSLRRLMSRNPFADRLTFVYDLPQLVGIGLAAQAVAADLPGFSEWLSGVLQDDRLQPSDRFQALLREHVRALLTGQTAAVHTQQGDDVSVIALRYWMASAGTAHPPDPAEHRELQKRIASEALRTDPAQLPVSRIALIYRAVTAILDASIEQAILSRSHLVTVLSRFEAAMRRWRCDDEQHETADPVARHRRARSPGHPLAHAPPGLRRRRRRGNAAQSSGTAPTGLTSASRAWACSSKSSTSARAAIDQAILSRSHLVTVLSRLEAAMRRWRCDDNSVKHPIRWPVTAEREVQDILWLILRPVFDDLVDEETLPKLGHSTYRADFGIPSLGILIEVKYVRKSSDFKEVEKQVLEDSVAYLNGVTAYKEIVVFIYDDSASVQEHDTTATALRSIDGISDVIIVSRPSQLASPTLPSQPTDTAKPSRQTARK